MASVALALQADTVLLVLSAAVLSLRAWHRRSGALALLALAIWAMAVHSGRSWQTPEALPFVDRVPQSGFEQSPGIGLAIALLQVLPLWPALRHRPARLHGFVWGLLMALSLPGWLPSPLLGFGGSLIVAYLLSLALLADGTGGRPPQDPGPPRRTAPRTHPLGPARA